MNAISSISAVAAVAALLLAGCRREDAAAPSGETRTLGIRFTTEQPLSDDGEAVGPVLALRFEEGTLREVLAGTLTAETGLHLFPLTRAAGELRFVANGADFAASGLPEPGAPLGELLDRVLPLDGMTSGGAASHRVAAARRTDGPYAGGGAAAQRRAGRSLDARPGRAGPCPHAPRCGRPGLRLRARGGGDGSRRRGDGVFARLRRGAADVELRPGGVVDAAASEIPADMRLSAACDTLYIPHTASACRLVLRAEAGSRLLVGGSVRGVTVSSQALTRGLEPVVEVRVQTPLRMPGTVEEYISLDLLREEVALGRVVLRFAPNPLGIEGSLRFDDDGVCDYGRYVEGELARLTLPAGRTLRLEFDGGESSWMKLSPDGGAWRLLGGWRPNDPTATGRVQEGALVISDADGGHAERYVVRRRNWGLPVVRIGDTWWCKYNLRGDATRFEDQITAADDPAADAELADYLASCDDAELLRLLGDQYQGGNVQGLPLRHDGEAFHYEGMASAGGNFGTLDPASMVPEGYRVPGYDDYAFLAGSENFNLGGVGERTYRNAADEELTVRILERQVAFLGHDYGPVALYEFRHGGEAWVLCGLGHQWNPTPGNIAGMTLLLATWGNSSKTWVMEGYAQAVKPGQNWLKHVTNNTTKTRTLRCVKTPVEYEYE